MVCCHRTCDSPQLHRPGFAKGGFTKASSFRIASYLFYCSTKRVLALAAATGLMRCDLAATNSARSTPASRSPNRGRDPFDRCRPMGLRLGRLHDDRLTLLAAGAGPFPFTPRCLDDRPDLARPAGKKRGTGLFYARQAFQPDTQFIPVRLESLTYRVASPSLPSRCYKGLQASHGRTQNISVHRHRRLGRAEGRDARPSDAERDQAFIEQILSPHRARIEQELDRAWRPRRLDRRRRPLSRVFRHDQRRPLGRRH